MPRMAILYMHCRYSHQGVFLLNACSASHVGELRPGQAPLTVACYTEAGGCRRRPSIGRHISHGGHIQGNDRCRGMAERESSELRSAALMLQLHGVERHTCKTTKIKRLGHRLGTCKANAAWWSVGRLRLLAKCQVPAQPAAPSQRGDRLHRLVLLFSSCHLHQFYPSQHIMSSSIGMPIGGTAAWATRGDLIITRTTGPPCLRIARHSPHQT